MPEADGLQSQKTTKGSTPVSEEKGAEATESKRFQFLLLADRIGGTLCGPLLMP